MAIDHGSKRVGIAITDPLKLIATGLTTVRTHEAIAFIEDYLKKEEVEAIIVGEPRSLRNLSTDGTREADNFAKTLKKKFPGKKIERMDERFTSKMAFQTMIDSGLKKKDRQKKELIDEISATIILQNYLELINRP